MSHLAPRAARNPGDVLLPVRLRVRRRRAAAAEPSGRAAAGAAVSADASFAPGDRVSGPRRSRRRRIAVEILRLDPHANLHLAPLQPRGALRREHQRKLQQRRHLQPAGGSPSAPNTGMCAHATTSSGPGAPPPPNASFRSGGCAACSSSTSFVAAVTATPRRDTSRATCTARGTRAIVRGWFQRAALAREPLRRRRLARVRGPRTAPPRVSRANPSGPSGRRLPSSPEP